MTVISLFTRQIARTREGNSGQAAVLFLTVASAILALLFSVLYTAHLGVARIASSNAIDAIALSAATWEARGLNLIASLNDGILQCLRAIRWICIVWAALAIAACSGAGMPAFSAYSRRAPGMIRSYWNCAKQLEQWSGKIRDLTPYLVLAETADLSKRMNVIGALSPADPRGPHDGENTLELHLRPGPPLSLADALSPISGVPSRISRWKWARKIAGKITGVIDSAVRSLLGTGETTIRMLEPEEDFPKRQKIRFAGYRSVSSLSIPFPDFPAEHRLPAESFAEPYGGGVTEMNWKSRMTEKPEQQ